MLSCIFIINLNVKFFNSCIIQSRVSSFYVLPNFYVFKDFQFHLFFRNHFVPINQFSFQGLKKLSATALSEQFPIRLILRVIFLGIKNIYKLFASISDKSVRIKIKPSSIFRFLTAIFQARSIVCFFCSLSLGSSVLIHSLKLQTIIFLSYKSIIVVRYKNPSLVWI
jgi:hypothetical protein